jgi:hypothetical protein
MMLKRVIGLVFAGAMAWSAMAADIVVRIGPPRAVRDRRERRPSRRHVWISGYQRWDGHAYSWNRGRWEQPPRERARWVRHHWVHQRSGWVFVEGHWR